jgi:RNase H-fold protein (predicted Holliday junction resolvase)
MITLGTSQKDRQNEDAYSAMLILQQFLDKLS